jgi:DNA mismatch repair ATPase MutS
MDYEASLKYSVGFEGYLDLLRGIESGVRRKFLGKAVFTEDAESDTIFEGQYYPSHKNSAYIQNTMDLSKNTIITGVNASGKTTTLKTTALNVIFSQQVGYGFYDSAVLKPFHHIHSYLNIPDTSGRDSLFQAESRRCKEILDKIRDTGDTERHLTVFDELYSGTNPKEAAKSAHSLLKYLSKKPNVRFILTTHYVDVCKKFKKSDVIQNHKMVVEKKEDGGFIYTYKMRPGISTLEGGIAILKTMDYPAEILDSMNTNE